VIRDEKSLFLTIAWGSTEHLKLVRKKIAAFNTHLSNSNLPFTLNNIFYIHKVMPSTHSLSRSIKPFPEDILENAHATAEGAAAGVPLREYKGRAHDFSAADEKQTLRNPNNLPRLFRAILADWNCTRASWESLFTVLDVMNKVVHRPELGQDIIQREHAKRWQSAVKTQLRQFGETVTPDLAQWTEHFSTVAQQATASQDRFNMPYNILTTTAQASSVLLRQFMRGNPAKLSARDYFNACEEAMNPFAPALEEFDHPDTRGLLVCPIPQGPTTRTKLAGPLPSGGYLVNSGIRPGKSHGRR